MTGVWGGEWYRVVQGHTGAEHGGRVFTEVEDKGVQWKGIILSAAPEETKKL